jgi:hypothetical protein
LLFLILYTIAISRIDSRKIKIEWINKKSSELYEVILKNQRVNIIEERKNNKPIKKDKKNVFFK